MADIELVIKISEEDYETLMNINDDRLSSIIARKHLYNALANGKPLLKGHGALITKGQAVALVQFYQLNPQHFTFENLIEDIDKETPIIEADKENKE